MPVEQTTPNDRIKHLELIQAVVSRMAGNSSTLKGWTVTLVAALIALAAKDGNPVYLWAGFLPAVAFGALDAYYLHLERSFRHLYEAAAAPDTDVPLFTLQRPRVERGLRHYLSTFGQPVIWGFYSAIILALVGALLYLSANARPPIPPTA